VHVMHIYIYTGAGEEKAYSTVSDPKSHTAVY
jgi:hypothetical protein